MKALRLRIRLLAVLVGLFAANAWAAKPNLEGNIERPLRYRPEGADFIIENGSEFFNRPLYGNNSAFRVDTGDKPELSLYLPGRGGNLRFGVKTGAGGKWLFDADKVVARYRPGSMLYEIRDSLLSTATLRIAVLTLDRAEGAIVRIDLASDVQGLELVWAYGGVTGQRGSRDGDIGTEREPVSRYFQLRPEFCRSNTFLIAKSVFTLRSRPATIVGLSSPGSHLALADANQWASLQPLLASVGKPTELPVVIGQAKLTSGSIHLPRAPSRRPAEQRRERIVHVYGNARGATRSDAGGCVGWSSSRLLRLKIFHGFSRTRKVVVAPWRRRSLSRHRIRSSTPQRRRSASLRTGCGMNGRASSCTARWRGDPSCSAGVGPTRATTWAGTIVCAGI